MADLCCRSVCNLCTFASTASQLTLVSMSSETGQTRLLPYAASCILLLLLLLLTYHDYTYDIYSCFLVASILSILLV